MIADKDYFIHIRRMNPEYTVYEAVVEYLCSNPDVAVSIAKQLPIGNAPMDDYEFSDYLQSIDGVEAFRAGFRTGSQFSFGDSWFQPDGYGGFVSMTDNECRTWSIQTIRDGYVDDIIEGRFDIPSELREIIDLWGSEERDPYPWRYLNVRPASAPSTKKTMPKAKSGRASKRSKR